MKQQNLLLALVIVVSLAAGGCNYGSISAGDVIAATHSVVRVGEAVAKSFEDITPYQEYYIGRAVGANVLGKYPVYDDKKANQYVNELGQTLAMASDRPLTYGGYHFLILDSSDINAFAAPGGLIFITRGMIDCCPDEDALAAVLAHEISHVTLKHGLRSIENSRLTEAFGVAAQEGARHFAPGEVSGLLNAFSGSITDVTKTLVVNGYSRSYEREADKAAVRILTRVGYNKAAIATMLQEMDKRLKPGGMDFAKTHPAPSDRLSDVGVAAAEYPVPEPRQERYQGALKSIL